MAGMASLWGETLHPAMDPRSTAENAVLPMALGASWCGGIVPGKGMSRVKNRFSFSPHRNPCFLGAPP